LDWVANPVQHNGIKEIRFLVGSNLNGTLARPKSVPTPARGNQKNFSVWITESKIYFGNQKLAFHALLITPTHHQPLTINH